MQCNGERKFILTDENNLKVCELSLPNRTNIKQLVQQMKTVAAVLDGSVC